LDIAVALAVILTGLGFALLQLGSRSDGVACLAVHHRPCARASLKRTPRDDEGSPDDAAARLSTSYRSFKTSLAAQKAETKRLSEQIAAVTAKLEALQQSFAEFPLRLVLRLHRRPNLAANKSAWMGRPIG